VRPRQPSLLTALFYLTVCLVVFADHASCETPSSEIIEFIQAENADTISIEEKVAFISPSGEEITPSPGTYRVQSVGSSALRLVPFERTDAFVIKAQSRKHDEEVGVPVALLAIDDEYQVHVLLLLPQFKSLEAIGSSRRGRSRSSPELLSSSQIHEALKRKAGKP
jgi:hypothetical protein